VNILAKYLSLYAQYINSHQSPRKQPLFELAESEQCSLFDAYFDVLPEMNQSAQFAQFVDQYLRTKSNSNSQLLDCELESCKCMQINTRQRLTPENENEENNEQMDYRHLTGLDLLLCTIHCTLLHAFDTGCRMNNRERHIIQQQANKNKSMHNDDEEDDNDEDDEQIEDEDEKKHSVFDID
jgi:hypothetical protein